MAYIIISQLRGGPKPFTFGGFESLEEFKQYVRENDLISHSDTMVLEVKTYPFSDTRLVWTKETGWCY